MVFNISLKSHFWKSSGHNGGRRHSLRFDLPILTVRFEPMAGVRKECVEFGPESL
jgi:hypothetical protein